MAIVSLLTIGSPALGQDKVKLCNEKQAEYFRLEQEQQSLQKDIDYGPSMISNARVDLGLFNRALAGIDNPEWRTSKIRSDLNIRYAGDHAFTILASMYGVDQNYDNVRLDDRQSLRSFLRAIRPHIINRIERLKYLAANPAAAQQELENYRTRQMAVMAEFRSMNCDKPGKPETQGSPCTLEGTWTQFAEGLGSSTWYVTADGKARETGLGASTGTANVNKNVVRIDWTNPNGWSGYYEWTMDSNCKTGTGTLVFKSGGSGSRKSNVDH